MPGLDPKRAVALTPDGGGQDAGPLSAGYRYSPDGQPDHAFSFHGAGDDIPGYADGGRIFSQLELPPSDSR